jgi:hypothetical protein
VFWVLFERFRFVSFRFVSFRFGFIAFLVFGSFALIWGIIFHLSGMRLCPTLSTSRECRCLLDTNDTSAEMCCEVVFFFSWLSGAVLCAFLPTSGALVWSDVEADQPEIDLSV